VINHHAIQLALRTKLLTLEVCTTGSVQLSATATGYERASGSFLTDGFVPGMEVAGASFTGAANNANKTISSVTALTMTCPGTTVEAVGARTLTVGLPASRAWENIAHEPTSNKPYVQEEYIPGPMEKTTLGPLGETETLPLYVPRVFVVAGNGADAGRKYADALIEHFAPGTSFTVSGHTVVVRSVPAPFSGQLLQAGPGFAFVPVTVPLRVRTANSI